MSGNVEVVTVGHAIVDVMGPATDDLVASHGLRKGTMTLVDDSRSEYVYRSFTPATRASGGSAANTAAGLASLGATVSFVGKVGRDHLGSVFASDIRSTGVVFDVPASRSGLGTGRCMIMVTPEGEKTMCTNLGVGDYVETDDVDMGAIADAKVVYIEGYLCGLPTTDRTVEVAIDHARSNGTTVALSLSDPFWVELHAKDLDRVIDRVDLLFSNEEEATLMTGASSLDAAISSLAARCPTVVVTRGSYGSVVVSDGRRVDLDAEKIDSVVDTTGAGDLYAAGYLFGVVRGFTAEECGRLGGTVAAEVLGHMGPRPSRSLAGLVPAARIA